jgi:hypothetical protein
VCVSETSEAFNQITFPEDGDCVCVSETSEVSKQLTRLSAREEFIQCK